MRRFAARLLAHYDRARRDLPWRASRDPWAIWVSEIMLQQTRVEVVRDAWRRFLERFPTPAEWARASDTELLRTWQGLGYYRRARLLREGALQVTELYGGRVPSDPQQLGELRGVGEYTRGAIASIAFGACEPAVDGNVERVIARHAGIEEDVKKSVTKKRLRALAVAHLDRRRPGDFNQALMDLGASICTPRRPRCAECPVAEDCAARRAGIQDRLPRLPARPKTRAVLARAVLIAAGRGRVLAHRNATDAINAGQFELPGPGVLVHQPRAGAALARALSDRFGGRFEVGSEIARVRHGITNHRITLVVHAAHRKGRTSRQLSAVPNDDVRWSTPARKALGKICGGAAR